MNDTPRIVTVTLHTAVDRVLEVDGLTVGAHAKARVIARTPAGKGVNVSLALARLGCGSVATGFVGHDQDAAFNEHLRAAGPGRAVDQLLTVRGPTRENITLLDTAAGTDTHLRTQGYTVTERDITRLTAKLGLLAAGHSVILFSGSLPPGMDADQLRALVGIANGRGARVVLDLDGEALRAVVGPGLGIAAQPAWLVKPNLEELAEASGGGALEDEGAIRAAADRIAECVTWVAVTRGVEGAWLVGREGGAWSAQARTEGLDIVNTVGCGDSFLAGLVEGLTRGLKPDEALRRATAAATANACSAEAAAFRLDAVERAAERVRLTPLG